MVQQLIMKPVSVNLFQIAQQIYVGMAQHKINSKIVVVHNVNIYQSVSQATDLIIKHVIVNLLKLVQIIFAGMELNLIQTIIAAVQNVLHSLLAQQFLYLIMLHVLANQSKPSNLLILCHLFIMVVTI